MRYVAQDGRHLRARQVGHFVDKAVYRTLLVDVFELGGHGGRRHGRLFGGNGEVQQLNQHKADGVVDARPKPPQNAENAKAASAKLDHGGDRHHQATARSLAQHLQVFLAVARDVVFTGFGAALGHFGGQQRGVVGNQGAQAAPLTPDADKAGQQSHGILLGCVEVRQSSSWRMRTIRVRNWRTRNTSPTEMPSSPKWL